MGRMLDGCSRALQVALIAAAIGCMASGAQDGKPATTVASPAPAAAPVRAAEAPAPKPAEPASPSVPEPVRVTNPRVAEALRYDPADPLANLETADALDRPRAKKKVDPPKRGCAIVEEPRPVWQEPGIATVAAVDTEFVVAGYATRGDAEQLFIVRVTAAGKLQPIATETLKVRHTAKRVAGPGLAVDRSQGITVAYTDGRGKLLVQRITGARYGAAAALELSDGVDTRFAPAVAYAKRGALIAYTVGSTPMRSTLVRLDPQDQVISTHDITPVAMGAAAPAFVVGASPPILVTADARSGMSPIARVRLDSEGNPGTPEVAVPVGMMSQPPELAAAQSGEGTYVGYAGVGSAATSAVGVVKVAPKVGAPEALVKGTAYGALHLDAAASKQAVYFAMDAPTSAGKTPQHEVQVVRVDAQGAGPVLKIAADTGDATHAAIARASDASLGVVFSAKDGVFFAKLSCVD